MFDFVKRTRLQKRGLTCGKTRRKQGDKDLLLKLADNPWVRVAIFALFLIGVGALLATPAQNSPFFDSPYKAFLLATIIFITALIQFQVNHGPSFERNSRVLLVFGMIFLHLAFIRGITVLVDLQDFPEGYEFVVLPYAFAPIVLSVMIGRHHGLFAAVFTSLWGSLIVDSSHTLLFLIVNLVSGCVAVFVTRQVRRRSRLMRAGLFVGLTTLILGFALGQIVLPNLARPGIPADWGMVASQSLLAVGTGILTAMFVGGILPLLETLFGVTTEISWIELADLNHPVLRRMTIEAPGTYHHSLVVANLAEAAAEAIGAQGTMCRVCAYFHDIGKLVKPDYCIENIVDGHNPHDDLTPNMSALIIMAHVKDGVDMAIKKKLPCEVIDVIQQHHGTSLVYFFYRRAIDQQREIRDAVARGEANEEDIPEVREPSFRYPGPRPRFRESAIISLADAVESASRTLEKPTPAKIEQMIDEITASRIMDNQLDEANVTLQELSLVKKSFAQTLQSMLHNRITYPKEDSNLDDPKTEMRRRKKTMGGRTENRPGGDPRPSREKPQPSSTESRAASSSPATPSSSPTPGDKQKDRSGDKQKEKPGGKQKDKGTVSSAA